MGFLAVPSVAVSFVAKSLARFPPNASGFVNDSSARSAAALLVPSSLFFLFLCCAQIQRAASRCCMRYALRSGASESSRESVRAEASSCCLFMRNMSSQLGVYPVLSTAAAAAAAAAAAFAADDADVFCELCWRSFRYSCTCFRPSIAASAFAAPSPSSSGAARFTSGFAAAPSPSASLAIFRPSASSSPDHQVSSHDAKRVFLEASRSPPIIAAFSFSVSALRCQESMLCSTSAPVLPMISPTSRLCSVSEKCFSNKGHSSASSRATCVSRHTRTAAHAACRRRSTSFTVAFEGFGFAKDEEGTSSRDFAASSASPMPAATRKSRRHASRSTNSSASCSWSSVYECETLCSSSLSSSAGNTSSSSLRLWAR